MLHSRQFFPPVPAVPAQRPPSAALERAHMDFALLDITVVDGSTGLPLGRPWIAACIDDYTRCVLGIDISFEAPGRITLARCVEDALRPKAALNQKYPGIVNTWDAHGVMRELVLDNSVEFHSKSVRNKCDSLGISLHYATRKSPCFKSPTEHMLGALNAAIANSYSGTSSKNASKEKVKHDPLSSGAVISHDELHEIIRTWIVDVYHQRTHHALNATPATVWRSSINQADLPLPASRRFPGAYLTTWIRAIQRTSLFRLFRPL